MGTLASGSVFRAVAQFGSASGLGPEGPGFKSLQPDPGIEVFLFVIPNLSRDQTRFLFPEEKAFPFQL
jgi:hypothetical protein